MDISSATRALSALSQETRLRAFRLLVRAGSDGIAAGKIAAALDAPHNTVSSHLAILVNAGLIGARRQSRSVIYSIDFAGTRELLAFLVEDCCQGNPEICLPILDSLRPGACDAPTRTGDNR